MSPIGPCRRLSAPAMALGLAVLLASGARAQEAPNSEPAGVSFGAIPLLPTPSDVDLPMEEEGRWSIQAEDRVYSAGNVAYGVGRTTVSFGEYTLSADRMVLDVITEEAQAEGNVVFTGPNEIITATQARYNLREHQGVAFGVEGKSDRFYFRARRDEDTEGPAFRRVNEDEALFRGASGTACDFPVPHYYITASEIILQVDDRIFFRDAVVYVRGAPVLYLPFYTRKLEGGTPWFIQAGYKSDYGGFMRLGYQFTHTSRVPSWENPSVYRTRSSGRLVVFGEYYTQGAGGGGLQYDYKLDYGAHIGSAMIYGIRDNVRDVEDDDSQENRYAYRHTHNSLLGKTLFQYDVNWASDPDIYKDLLDDYAGGKTGRLVERRARAALTHVEQDWIAGVMAEMKDRISRDRYQDYSDLTDDDLNFDPDPDFTTVNDIDTDGISRKRYGRVTERVQGKAATRLLPLFRSPLYYNAEANAFTAKDAGFNEINDEDDARYYGGDFYGAFTNRIRLDKDGRYTWLNTLGGGVATYWRDTGGLAPRSLAGGPGITQLDAVRFADRKTILPGTGGRQVSYRDVESGYAWMDFKSRLNARFTDTLSGFLEYTYRLGTQDGVGQFFEEIGRQEAYGDIYNFPVNYHWLEGYLNYTLRHPNIDVFLAGGQNLQSDSDIFANERIRYVSSGVGYANSTREITANVFGGIEERQIRDLDDPNEFERAEVFVALATGYTPRHGRYWGRINVSGYKMLDDDPVSQPARKRARFDEEDTQITIRPTIGRKFGPKYTVEAAAEYDTRLEDFKEAGVTILRDLHDADLMLFLGMQTNTFTDRDDRDDTNESKPEGDREMVVRAGLRFKQPGRSVAEEPAISFYTSPNRPDEPSFVQ